MTVRQSTLRQRVAAFVGLGYLPDGKPSHGGGPSRYAQGFGLSPRLDEDLDALARRVASLEARLDKEM